MFIVQSLQQEQEVWIIHTTEGIEITMYEKATTSNRPLIDKQTPLKNFVKFPT